MVIKVDNKNKQVSIPDELLDYFSIHIFGVPYLSEKKEANKRIREIYKDENFSSSKELQNYIYGEILMKTQVPIIRNVQAVSVDDRLLNKVSLLISNNELPYMENSTKTHQAIRRYFLEHNLKDSKELDTHLTNFFLEKKLKQQIEKEGFGGLFNVVTYSYADLESLCVKNSYKLICDDEKIAIYPIKDEEIAEDIPYLKELLNSFDTTDKQSAKKIASDFLYKELIFLEKN